MRKHPLDILQFVTHPELCNDQALSPAQRTCLKVVYGLPLDVQECEIHDRATGRSEYSATEQNEATIIVGRRGGKTSKIAAPIACYEAFRNHGLPRGERGYVLLIAPVKQQAAIALRSVRAYIRSSPLLSSMVDQERRGEIVFKNGIAIACQPCSYVTLRGVAVVCAICDEMAFWRHEETAANPEEEVLDALRPAMATFPKSKLIKISTPYRKEGILWREFQQRAELDHLVWQLPSPEMNPSLQPSILEKARKHGEETFRREYLAEFTDQITGWVGPDVLDPCIVHGRKELPRVENARYVAAIDPAFKRNDFALAILHRTNDNAPVVVDRVARWAGTAKAPLGYEWVCGEIVRILQQFGINKVIGDQYCAPVINQHLQGLGILYQERTFGSNTRADIFGNLKHLMVQRKLELLDDALLLRQLRGLEEHGTSSGNVDIRPAHAQKDDLAVVIALAAYELANRSTEVDPWVEVITFPAPVSALGKAGGAIDRFWWRIPG